MFGDKAASAKPSSRDSLAGAGWDGGETGTYKDLIPPNRRRRRFSWLDPRTLWRSRRNEWIARYLEDPVVDERRRIVAAQQRRPNIPKDLVINHANNDAARFLVVGDTGEGDESQYAVVPPLLEVGGDTQFMVVCSDVVYPDGDVNEYLPKFYEPYKDYPGPIYALPGNHDWCDGLNGFMVHLCGAEPSERSPGSNRLLRRLWRRPSRVEPELLRRCRELRPHQTGGQPGPYFAIDVSPLRVVCIDTGINGQIDREQGEWLRRVSRGSSRPKILLTGKPIYVDNEHHPGRIEGSLATVDDIVRAAEHNFVAAIGGDIHNYQRYPVKVGARKIQYIVSGGGGAYMSDTHRIPRVTAGGVAEGDFRCYPLRGDSLSAYSRVLDRRFFFGRGLAYIPPDEAAALVGERLGIHPTRPAEERGRPRRRKRFVAGLPFLRTPRRVRGRVLLEPFFLPAVSEVFDWDDPPFFKNFLLVEATRDELTITCHGITGRAEHENSPPVEDRVSIRLR